MCDSPQMPAVQLDRSILYPHPQRKRWAQQSPVTQQLLWGIKKSLQNQLFADINCCTRGWPFSCSPWRTASLKVRKCAWGQSPSWVLLCSMASRALSYSPIWRNQEQRLRWVCVGVVCVCMYVMWCVCVCVWASVTRGAVPAIWQCSCPSLHHLGTDSENNCTRWQPRWTLTSDWPEKPGPREQGGTVWGICGQWGSQCCGQWCSPQPAACSLRHDHAPAATPDSVRIR